MSNGQEVECFMGVGLQQASVGLTEWRQMSMA